MRQSRLCSAVSSGPIEWAGRLACGLRFADPRVHALWHGPMRFRHLPGFRRADLRNHLDELSGRAPETLAQGALTYQFRHLRLDGIIHRLPNTQRYRVTDTGFPTAVFFVCSVPASPSLCRDTDPPSPLSNWLSTN